LALTSYQDLGSDISLCRLVPWKIPQTVKWALNGPNNFEGILVLVSLLVNILQQRKKMLYLKLFIRHHKTECIDYLM